MIQIYLLLITVILNVFSSHEESVNFSASSTETNDSLILTGYELMDVADEDIPGNNKLSEDDKEIALEHLSEDLQLFEQLKYKVDHIEEHLRKHADRHIINEDEVVETDKMLHEVDKQVMKPFEQGLLAIKDLIEKSDDKFDNRSVEQMVALVENAEEFLEKAQLKIEEVEMKDHEWDGLEESQLMQDIIDKEHKNKGILLEALRPSTNKQIKPTDGLKKVSAPYPGMKLGVLSSNVKVKKIINADVGSGTSYDERMKIKDLNKEPINKGIIMEALRPSKNGTNKNNKSTDGLKKVAAPYPGMKLDPLSSNGKVQKKKNINAGRGISYVERMKVTANEEYKLEQSKPIKKVKTDRKDSVVGLINPNIKKALDSAAESSHKFIDKKLKHHALDSKNEATSVFMFITLAIMIVAIAVMILVGYFFGISRRRGQAKFNNLKEVDDNVKCQMSYSHLSELKEGEAKEIEEDSTALKNMNYLKTPPKRRTRQSTL